MYDRYALEINGHPIEEHRCVHCNAVVHWHSRRERERHLVSCVAIALGRQKPIEHPPMPPVVYPNRALNDTFAWDLQRGAFGASIGRMFRGLAAGVEDGSR